MKPLHFIVVGQPREAPCPSEVWFCRDRAEANERAARYLEEHAGDPSPRVYISQYVALVDLNPNMDEDPVRFTEYARCSN